MTTLEKILQEIDKYENTGMFMPCPGYIKKILEEHLSGMGTNAPINEGWIPVDTENIPDTEVLCCDEYGHIVSGYLSEFKGECICESPMIIMRNVVAWTSKPNPYRKDGE